MSRPRKFNADWFKHDNNMRNDEKLQALLNKFGVAGYGIHCATMEVLTGADNHKITYSVIDLEIFVSGLRSDIETVLNVWQYLCKLGIYQLEIKQNQWYHLSYKNLTESLQNVKRKREFSQQQYKTEVKTETPFSETETPFSETETPFSETETPFSETETSQRKRERENKRKNKKEREIKNENSHSVFNPSLLSEIYLDFKTELTSKQILRPSELLPMVEKFLNYQSKKNKTWPTETDCINHFKKWLPSEIKTIQQKVVVPSISKNLS